MDVIHICQFEVFYHVGVPDAERVRAQRLLLDIQMELDFRAAAAADDLTKTIDYFAVTERLKKFGDGREWKLIETLADEIAAMLASEFGAKATRVEVRKFIIPAAKYVAVIVERGGFSSHHPR